MSTTDPVSRDDCQSRFESVTRRMVLRRAAIMSGLILMPGIACSSDDKDVFASSSTASTAATTATTEAATTSTEASTTTSAPTSSTEGTAAPTTEPPTTAAPTTEAPATTEATASGASFPAGGEVLINFTYAATSGGRVHNPYTAVWIEDTNGSLVSVVAAWYLQEPKGQRWLNELRRWYSIGGVEASSAVTGATRPAGDFSLTWNGTDLNGNPVPAGEYVVLIEAAREKGPYELVTGSLTVSDQGFSADFTPQGELTAASVELKV